MVSLIHHEVHQADPDWDRDDVLSACVSFPKLPVASLSHSCFLLFLTEWSGINALLYYGPTLMGELGLQGDSVTLMVSGGIGVVQFVAVLPVIILIDRLGT